MDDKKMKEVIKERKGKMKVFIFYALCDNAI